MKSLSDKHFLENMANQYSWGNILEPAGFNSRQTDTLRDTKEPVLSWIFDDGEHFLEIQTFDENSPALIVDFSHQGNQMLTKFEAIKKFRCDGDWNYTKALIIEGLSLQQNVIDQIARKKWEQYMHSSSQMAAEVRYIADPLFQASVDSKTSKLVEDDFANQRFLEMQFALEGEPQRSVSLKELLAKIIQKSKWVIDSLLPLGARVFLVAQAKAGKTSMAMHLVKCLADGVDFLSRFHVNSPSGRIGYMNFEMTENQIQEWLARQKIENIDKVSIWNLRGKPNPFRSKISRKVLVSELQELNITTLIIDTFAKTFSGDANSNSEVTRFLLLLEEVLQEAGVEQLIMLVHAGNAEKKIRGATALTDHPDGLWFISTDSERNRYFHAIGRDIDLPEGKLVFDSSKTTFSYQEGNRQVSKESSTFEKMLTFISENPGSNAASVDESVNGTKTYKIKIRKKLVDQGLVEIRKGPNNSSLYYVA